MQNSSKLRTRLGLFAALFILGLGAVLTFIAPSFQSRAVSQGGKGLFERTTTQEEGLEYFDVREDKNSQDLLVQFRQAAGRDAAGTADLRDSMVAGELALRERIPSLQVSFSSLMGIPEIVEGDFLNRRIVLERASSAKRSERLRAFTRENSELFGMRDDQIESLKTTADYANPDGKLSFAMLEQFIDGIPVFRSQIKAGFAYNGDMFRIINDLTPGLEESSLSKDFGDPADAVRVAAADVRAQVDMTPNAKSTDLKAVFGDGYYPTTASKYYFPIEPGVARAAWYVVVWKPVNGYELFIDAETHKVLWRQNMAKDQTQAATYNVWANSTSMMRAMDSPAPLSPGPIDPVLGTQGALQPRTSVTLIGNEAPYSFNNNGWITDGANSLTGNNVHAGLDRATPNGPDEPIVTGTARVFNFPGTFPPGTPEPGGYPLPTGQTATPCAAAPPAVSDSQRVAVTQMFYVVNRLHDELYLHGFTEQARNFQVDNFGRGGTGGDAVIAEGQDCSGTNNANFASTSTDGSVGRMQMYLWTPPTPVGRDGTVDADIIIHEIGHGVTNRLHTSGISGTQGGQMHEGNGDFLAHLMLSETTDPINGVYTTGGYSTMNLRTAAPFSSLGNYYYGIRRFPKAAIGFTGGANARSHNPLTYADIDPAQLNTSNGAFAPAFAGSATAVHDGGEIWSSMLWEVRARLITRLGHTAGTSKMLQLFVDGMKLTGSTSTMLNSRNSIIAAAQASAAAPEAAADVIDVREGFRLRGLGYSATNTTGNTVVEAFDSPDLQANSIAVTSGNNLLEPNECNTVNVPVSNNSANAATGITAVLSSNTPGITVTQPNSAYPDMAGGAGPVNNTTAYQVQVDNTVACFTTANFTLTVTYSGGGGGSPATFNFSLPVGQAGTDYAFTTSTGTIPAGGTFVPLSDDDDFVVSVPMPAGWSSTVYGVPVTTLSASTNGMLTVNGPAATTVTNTALPTAAAVGGANPTLFPAWDDWDMDAADTVNGGIFVNTVGSAPNRQLYVEWKATHFSETTTAISTNFAVLLTEGSDVVRYIYALTGGPTANGASATVGIQKTAGAGSVFTQVGFNTTGTITPGLQLTGARPAGVCTPGPGGCGVVPTVRSRADFDGDGKTDVSVFRPSEGNWYLNQSTAGFGVINWGIATDVLVPGDYDGDGKADTAVFRATADPSQPDYYILRSNGFTLQGISWGIAGDMPMNGDYDGDSKTDAAIYRPSTQTWYILNSSNGSNTVANFGAAGDVPLVIDNNGDGKDNLAVFRPSQNTWYIAKPTGVPAQNFDAVLFGATGDLLVPADYDGDNKGDIAVFRPSTGVWYILRSTGGVDFVAWGSAGDVPAPGDYDGDGKDDQAVYRNGIWYVKSSTSGVSILSFGLGTDKPIPASYIP